MANCLIVAGEVSGEEHALSFLPDLMKQRPDLHFWGVGGEELRKRGVELKFHIKDFSSVGVSEVVKKLPFYLNATKNILEHAQKNQTRDALLIDFQGFNLELAKKLTRAGIRVWYYVAPQAWVWKAGRSEQLRKYTHHLFTILPFEEQWFSERGVKSITSVPHPLLKNWHDQLKHSDIRIWSTQLQQAPRLLVLPGSRNAEVVHHLEPFCEALKLFRQKFPAAHVTLSTVETVKENYYQMIMPFINQRITSQQLPDKLSQIDVALASSGTVTLGTALMRVPTIVAYRSTLLNQFLFNHVVGYKGYLCLTNLILGKALFPEFLGESCQGKLLFQGLEKLLQKDAWLSIQEDLANLLEKVSQGEKDVGYFLAQRLAK
jgi:lipid-A-disaccharide synthase